MNALAPEVSATKRKATLELLLGRIQSNARGGKTRPSAPPRAKPAAEKISAEDPRWGAPPKPPAQEKISAEDPRWGAPPKPPAQEKISAEDPRWGAPPKPPAQEKISAEDPRWGSPPKPPVQAKAAPPQAAKAPTGDRAARLNALLARIRANGRRR